MNTILIDKIGAVAKLTLNRPEVYNSFNRIMALALQGAFRQIQEDDSIRAVYLSGTGKAFSAGQDLQEISGENKIPIGTILAEHYNPLARAMRKLTKPIVVAVNGVAAGAGANLAFCGDVVVAKESASFIQAFSKIGLIPDSGGTYTLPRLIGFQKASALMMLGDKISAHEAERMGMIYKVFNEEEFETKSWEIVQKLASMPTHGLALTKEALNNTFKNDFNEQLALEDQYQQEAAQTHDYNEGVQAFLEKRKPRFIGK